MGGHHNCVASSLSRRIDNRLVGVLVFNLHHIAGHASRRGSILRRLEIFPGKSGHTFFVLVRRVRHMTGSTAKIWKGSDTVTAVTLALRAFASPMPWSTALFDNSDPSVGIRICLYICTSLKISSMRGAAQRPIIASMRRYARPPHPHVGRYQATKNRSDGRCSTNESFSAQASRPHTCQAR